MCNELPGFFQHRDEKIIKVQYKIIKIYNFLLNITTYFSVFLSSVLIYPGENLQIERGIQPKEDTDKHNIT